MNRERERGNLQINKFIIGGIAAITLMGGTVGTSLLLANSYLPVADSLQTNNAPNKTIDRVRLVELEVPPFRQDAPTQIR